MIVRPTDWVTMPWKNGGGITHEVLRIGPPDAFDLRISVAEVASSGPFSRFPGVHRTILLLEGAGFVLTRDDGRVVRITRPHEPFEFSGEEGWSCALVDGPVRDLNIMSRRTSPARVTVEHGPLVLAPGELAFVVAPGPDQHTLVGAEEETSLDAERVVWIRRSAVHPGA